MLTWEEDVEAAALQKRGWSISAIARHLARDRLHPRQRHRGRTPCGHRLIRLDLAERNATNLHDRTRGHTSPHPTHCSVTHQDNGLVSCASAPTPPTPHAPPWR